MEYQRILQQRNMALRSRSGSRWYPADNAELEAWDRQLVAVGSRIIRKRDEVLGKMNPLVSLFHQQISDGGEQLSLTYKPACELSEEGEIEGQFQKALAGVREKERKFGMTLVGPHRDDVIMSVNGLDLRAFGSQGQQRTAATALKLAAASFLEETMGEQPILLLDDIFAELDRERTRLLFNLLVEYSQLFIATAKESDLAGYGKRLHRMAIVGGAVRAA
jgi:DNA replication and repair protein RecF